jgi:hypothetical protein
MKRSSPANSIALMMVTVAMSTVCLSSFQQGFFEDFFGTDGLLPFVEREKPKALSLCMENR